MKIQRERNGNKKSGWNFYYENLEYKGNNHTNNRVYTPIIGTQNGDNHQQMIWGYSLSRKTQRHDTIR